jgi:hypothetical protein
MAIFRGPGGAGDATADATNAASVAQGFANNAASSASAAAGSATTASTQATNAGTSATAAASSASAASTSASNASTSASNASTSASNASSSASTAATAQAAAELAETGAETAQAAAEAAQAAAETAETNAETAETGAVAAQTAAEAARDATLAAYDNFDDRYLGAKTSDPTLDNDGNALVAGALYFNSVAGEMRLYTGSAWVAAYVSGAGFLASANNLSDLTNTATARQNLDLEVGVDVQAYDATILKSADIGVTVQGYDATLLNDADIGVTVQGYDATIVVDADIGVSVQAYDADTAKTDVAQTFTASQRGTVTTDNDGSLDLSVTNNFQCTPSGSITLTFTNRTAGQSGFILLINTGAHTVSAHADTEVSTTALATISAAGTYLLSYFATSTNVYVVNSGALA